MEIAYDCAYCGETNDLSVDASAGPSQEYVEDCQVCCRPNVLRITLSLEDGEATVEVRREDE